MSPTVLSIKLAIWTVVLLIPLGLLLGRWLAITQLRIGAFVESLVMLPLVLPPTVIGYYLLVLFAPDSLVGGWLITLFDTRLVFSFEGLVIASMLVNVPFAVQPIMQAFANIPNDVREASWVSGLSSWQTFWRIELPMTWAGVLGASVLTFAHTLGEFGVVLMVGGNIPGVTRTLSIDIYDNVQAFDMVAAGRLTLGLLLSSILALVVVRMMSQRKRRRAR